jgi:hypothetical protein
MDTYDRKDIRSEAFGLHVDGEVISRDCGKIKQIGEYDQPAAVSGLQTADGRPGRPADTGPAAREQSVVGPCHVPSTPSPGSAFEAYVRRYFPDFRRSRLLQDYFRQRPDIDIDAYIKFVEYRFDHLGIPRPGSNPTTWPPGKDPVKTPGWFIDALYKFVGDADRTPSTEGAPFDLDVKGTVYRIPGDNNRALAAWLFSRHVEDEDLPQSLINAAGGSNASQIISVIEAKLSPNSWSNMKNPAAYLTGMAGKWRTEIRAAPWRPSAGSVAPTTESSAPSSNLWDEMLRVAYPQSVAWGVLPPANWHRFPVD